MFRPVTMTYKTQIFVLFILNVLIFTAMGFPMTDENSEFSSHLRKRYAGDAFAQVAVRWTLIAIVIFLISLCCFCGRRACGNNSNGGYIHTQPTYVNTTPQTYVSNVPPAYNVNNPPIYTPPTYTPPTYTQPTYNAGTNIPPNYPNNNNNNNINNNRNINNNDSQNIHDENVKPEASDVHDENVKSD